MRGRRRLFLALISRPAPLPSDLRGQGGHGEVPVGEQQHPRPQAPQQTWGVTGLPDPIGAEYDVDDGAGAARDYREQPHHRIPGTAVRAALATVCGQVGAAVGHGQRRAVNRADQQSPPPRRSGGRTGEQLEQRPQRSRPDPAAGLGQRGPARLATLAPCKPATSRATPAGTLTGEQSPGQQQIHHHPRRQVTNAGWHPPRRRQDRIDHLERNDLGQLTEMTRREPAAGYRDRAYDDRIIRQRDSRQNKVIFVDTRSTGAPFPCHTTPSTR